MRKADGHRVVLRVLDGNDPVAGKIERLKHELDLRSTLQGLPAVEPLALSTLNGVPALELEDFVGESLDRLVTAPLSVDDFLPLAISVAAAVGDIHSRGLVHKDLNPGSILFDPKTRRVKVANFGAASRVAREQTAAGPERLLEESLPYVSPEQTGRMNRAVDCRSDLYSLGVTYYRLLTGRLPFTASDAIGWVHCHVARKPAPLARFRDALPSVLSEIVLKLLAKVPDDRYQSAAGLQRDLERCLRQWREMGTIAPFALGAEDTSDRFLVPQTVYGREAEFAALREAFERVVVTGQPELVLVSGPSGIGKSAVVHELRRPIIGRQGLFLSAKFERGKHDIPYLAVIRAFRELTLDILTESTDQISAWRRRIIDALGPNGQLIVDVLPEIELLIGPGPQPEPPELPLGDAENRMRMVVRQFACAFARPDHPLTLFLDDLQWVDSASANLVADLATDPDTRHVLLIATSRTEETPAAQPVAAILDKLRARGAVVREIALGPLAGDAVDRLVADTVHRRAAEAAPLARLVRDKTGGNPFFAIHFLTGLYSKRLITFDRATGRWTWDMARVRAEHTTDNVVDLMVAKLRALPRPTQEALSLAAHIGAIVDGRAMAAVLGRDPESALKAAVEEDLMLRIDHSCRFPHDRVQEAAYSLVPEADRAGLHLEIGRRLWAQTPPAERGERTFEIATQLNFGASLIASPDERETVAEINLSAGKRAKESAAYASALTYLIAGCALLSEDCWQECYELTFALELNRAECEHLSGNSMAAEKRLSALSSRARTLADLAAVTCAEVEIFHTSHRTPRAVEAALGYLRQVGIGWTAHPAEKEVADEYAPFWQALGDRSIESLADLPAVSDPDCRATMDVLLAAFSPALITDTNLHDLVVGRVARLSLAHGNSDASCLAYVRLATMLGRRFGDYAKGFKFGKLGFDLVEQHGLLRFKAAVYLNFAASVIPWTKHLSTGLGLTRRSATAAEQTGNIAYACYARTRLITMLLAQGGALAETQKDVDEALAYTKTRFDLVADAIRTDRQLVRMLRGLLPRFGSLTDADLDEETFEVHLREPRMAITTCWYWIRKLQARFHANDFAAAVASADNAAPLLWTSTEFLETAEYHFYAALAHAARHDEVAPEDRGWHRDALVAHARRLGEWARQCPDNFGGRAALADAEIARIEGRVVDAERLYEWALTAARASGFVHDEAIVYETAARFWRARGYPLFADAYLQEACDRYRRWGAEGKVQQLQPLTRLHPGLGKPPPFSTISLAELPATSPDQLDLLSVIKASQTISGAMGRADLVRTLLQIVIEQGGARRACLVRVSGGELDIAAEQTFAPETDAGETAEAAPRAATGGVPSSILHYVARTCERVVLDDAAADAGRFAADPYLAGARPRSLLCLPIRREGRAVALLYLDNELAPGVFTPDRLVALELIAAQVAISLENALLLEREREGRVEAEADSRRALILGEATALVSSTFDYEDVFRALTRLCAREIADWAVIDLVDDDHIVRLAGAHRDPANDPLIRELSERYPARFAVRSLAMGVIDSGTPKHIADLAPEDVRRLCTDERHFDIIQTLGARSALSVPLVAREVRFGALSLGSATPHRFGDADVELVVEIGRRTALAIDNARLLVETQRAVHLRDQFLSTASHELRTPITSLKLTIESLIHGARGGPLPAAHAGRLQRVLHSTKRLEHLVNELLDVTRIEQGQATLSPAEMDLGALVRDVAQHFEFDLARAGCRLSVQYPGPGVGSVVGCWDASRLEQVVTNLLANAIKFGAGRPIDVMVRDAGQAAELQVTDHGIGIAADRLPKIFDRFERAVSSTHYGGLGLGLYLARAIVESHGGTITVTSRVDEGSTFTVRLPRTLPRQTP